MLFDITDMTVKGTSKFLVTISCGSLSKNIILPILEFLLKLSWSVDHLNRSSSKRKTISLYWAPVAIFTHMD